jgi:hypothetical protein
LKRIADADVLEERPDIMNWARPIVNIEKDIRTPKRPKTPKSGILVSFLYNSYKNRLSTTIPFISF